MKFNQLTLQTGHNNIQNTDNMYVSKECKQYFLNLMNEIVAGNRPRVVDEYFLEGKIMDSKFELHLTNKKGEFLVSSYGGLCVSNYDEMEPEYLSDYIRKDLPFIIDVMEDTLISTLNFKVANWSADFFRCMAGVIFQTQIEKQSKKIA